MFDDGVLWSVCGAKCGNDGLLTVVFLMVENRRVFHVYFHGCFYVPRSNGNGKSKRPGAKAPSRY
jgi:hypothetical protein